jgi:hypothetical protein
MADDFSFAKRLMDSEKSREDSPLKSQTESLAVTRSDGPGVSFSQRLAEKAKLRESGVHASSYDQASPDLRNQGIVNELNKEGFGVSKLGESGSLGFLDRADLALSDSFEEKKVKFLDKYPGGDFIQVPAIQLGAKDINTPPSNTIMFRRNKYESFAELDADVLEKFEIVGDLADLSGDIPAIVLEAIMTRGASLAKQALGAAFGSVSGDTIKEVVESLRGYQKETLGQDASRIAARGAIAAGGAAATGLITGPVNVAKGRGAIKLKPGAQEAQRAAADLDIPDLLWSQVASHPLVRRIQAQSEATTGRISEYLRTQQQRAVAALSTMKDEEALEFVAGGTESLLNMHRDAAKRLTMKLSGNDVGDIVKTPGVSMTRGGRSLQDEVNEYTNRSSLLVDRAYAIAREKGSPQFDISPLMAAANDVEAVVVARGMAVERRSSILGPDGQPITISQHEAVPLQKVHPQVQEQIDLIRRLDPELPTVKALDGREVDATEQLRAIRSNLWKLKQVNINASPEERARAEQASTLYSVLTHILKRPKNADPEFVSAWANANQMAAERFETLEKLVIVKAADTETPAQFVKRLAQPYQVDNIRTLKSAIPPERFKLFQRSVISDFIADNNVDNLSRRLAAFDKETLSELLPESTIARLKTIGVAIDRLKSAGIEDAIKAQGSFSASVKQLLANRDEAGLKTFVDLVTQREPTDKIRRTARASIMEDLFRGSVNVSDQGVSIDGKKFLSVMSDMESKGLLKVLTAQDRQMLNKFSDLAPYLKTSVDSGTSLVAAGLVGQLREMSSEAMMSFVHLMGIGRFLTNKHAQRIFLGTGNKSAKWNPAKLRVFGAVVAQEALDVEAESDM